VQLNIEAVDGKREAERRDGTCACVRSDGGEWICLCGGKCRDRLEETCLSTCRHR
jgi:hypothetical protein